MLFLRRIKLLAVLLLSISVSSCQPDVPISTPAPSPVLWNVHYTSTLSWLGAHFHSCTAEQADTSIVVFEQPAQAITPNEVDFAMRWGSPADISGYAAVIGYDEMVVIVHPDNPVAALSQEDLIDIYYGSIRFWSQYNPAGAAVTGRIRLWTYPTGSDIQDIFAAITGSDIQGDAVLYLAPDPAAMLEAVAADPAAIGYIPERWLDESVRSVELTGAEVQSLSHPILAFSRGEPQGEQRAWLLCLEERIRLANESVP
jgi:hypothetical protein